MNEACVHAGETMGTHSTGDACNAQTTKAA